MIRSTASASRSVAMVLDLGIAVQYKEHGTETPIASGRPYVFGSFSASGTIYKEVLGHKIAYVLSTEKNYTRKNQTYWKLYPIESEVIESKQ